MRKFIILIIPVLILMFSACSTQKKQVISNASNLEEIVAFDLENINKDNNLDDETLKSLSLIIRTNHIINNDYNNQKVKPSQKYINLTKQTSGQTIKNNDKLEYIDISNSEYRWTKSIKKTELLSFALENNISLSNISNIEPEYENSKIKNINIAGHSFDYEFLAKKFNLESNEIIDIKTTNKEFIIYGKNKGYNEKFSIYEASNLSKQGFSYKEIINKINTNLIIE